MGVCLRALHGPAAFDTVGEPATLWQRWRIWKDEFKLFVTASGIDDRKRQRALLLHLAGPSVREIFRTTPEETKGDAKDYKKAMESKAVNYSYTGMTVSYLCHNPFAKYHLGGSKT